MTDLPQSQAESEQTRQCIVTRELLTKQQLIRFVLSPDGVVTPDLSAKLPGRGMWVKADLASVATAVARQAFARAAKQSVVMPEGLASKVEKMLERRALDALAMARKSGLVVAGFEKVKTMLLAEKAACLIHAADAGSDGSKTLNAKAGDIPIFTCFSREALGIITSRENATHLAVGHGGAAQFFIDEARRFAGFS